MGALPLPCRAVRPWDPWAGHEASSLPQGSCQNLQMCVLLLEAPGAPSPMAPAAFGVGAERHSIPRRKLMGPPARPCFPSCPSGLCPSADLTSGRSQEDSYKHGSPAPGAGGGDPGDAHVAVGPGRVWCGGTRVELRAQGRLRVSWPRRDTATQGKLPRASAEQAGKRGGRPVGAGLLLGPISAPGGPRPVLLSPAGGASS